MSDLSQYSPGALAELLGVPVEHVRGAVRGMTQPNGKQRRWFTEGDLPEIRARLRTHEPLMSERQVERMVAQAPPPEAEEYVPPPPPIPTDDDLGEPEPVRPGDLAAVEEEAARLSEQGARRRRRGQ